MTRRTSDLAVRSEQCWERSWIQSASISGSRFTLIARSCITRRTSTTHCLDTAYMSITYMYTRRLYTGLIVHYIHLTAFLIGTTSVNRQQKGKPFLILLEQDMMGWQWHQPDHTQIIYTSLQTNNHACTSPLSFFKGRMPFLPPNQQRQSTEGV